MGKTKRKILHLRRRGESEDHSHWLGEGVNGQDSLLFDLDPYLYIADGTVSKTFSQISYHYDGENDRALAVVVAPTESVPWHAAFLRSRADVAVCVPEFDPILEAAGFELDLTVFVGGVPERLHGEADFLLYSGSRWESFESYQNALETAYAALAPQGKAVFVFPAIEEVLETGERQLSVDFVDGDRFTFERLVSRVRPERFHHMERLILPFSGLKKLPDFGVGEFAKRHRGFFGKSARELCLSRLYEEEFQTLIKDPTNRCAAILIVGDTQ